MNKLLDRLLNKPIFQETTENGHRMALAPKIRIPKFTEMDSRDKKELIKCIATSFDGEITRQEFFDILYLGSTFSTVDVIDTITYIRAGREERPKYTGVVRRLLNKCKALALTSNNKMVRDLATIELDNENK